MVILLVEDDTKIANFIKQALEHEYYTVELAPDGEEGLKKASIYDYDLVILDVLLPGKNGFEVCRQIRELGLNVPILMLTACDLPEEKVAGLNEGADDYLAKPFELNELLARILALTRRKGKLLPKKFVVRDLILDTGSHEAYLNNQLIKLTSKEYKILAYLMRNLGQVCSRTMINEHIWGFNYVKSNIIDVYMSRLRSKINAHAENPLIVTIYGVGYKIKAA